MSFYDYDPSGYREWWINSNKYIYGTTDKPTVMPSQKLLDVVAMTVLEAQVPYTFYTVNANNNVLFIANYVGTTISNMRILTIAQGNYTPATMITALTTTYPVVATTGSADTNYAFSAVTYSDSTGKFTLTPNSAIFNSSNTYIITNPTSAVAIAWQAAMVTAAQPRSNFALAMVEPIGLADITSLADVLFPSAAATTLPMIIALGGPSYIAIRGNFGMGGNKNILTCDDAPNNSTYSGNILAFIPVNTIPGGTITWKNLAPRGGFFDYPIATLEQAQLWITAGDEEEQLSLNGHSFQLKLGFMTGSRRQIVRGSPYTGDRGVTTSY